MDVSDYPKEWRTNKNLRWWLHNQPVEDIVSSPDDFFLHETSVVEFAKQFNAQELEFQAALIREAREIITWAAQPKIDITANECERIGSKIVDWLEKTKEI